MPRLRDTSILLSFISPRALATSALIGVTALIAACSKGETPAAQGAAKMPPPQVGIVVTTPGDIGLVTELPGRVEAARTAQVRARAAGILQQRLFREGSDVKAGQALFRIDSAPYAAALDSARASQAKAEANLAQASALVERYRPLVQANAISKQEFVNAETGLKQAQADLATSKANVRTAEIQLGYAQVTAPISGRIGRALVTEGALVGQGEATQLAVIQQIDTVYVNFTQSATEVFKLRKAMEAGQFKQTVTGSTSVRLVLSDGSEYPLPGKLLFSDLSVDASTGQVLLRAEVPNPKGELLPGLYVRVRIEQAQASNAITLPQQAVTRTQQGDVVNVVDSDGKVSVRPVKISAAQNNRWIVLEGLRAGEQVMVDGFQKLQMAPPGTPVKIVPWSPDGKQSPQGGAAADGSARGASKP